MLGQHELSGYGVIRAVGRGITGLHYCYDGFNDVYRYYFKLKKNEVCRNTNVYMSVECV